METQPEELRAYFAGDWADEYGLLNETTTAKAFQPAGVSRVPNREVIVGDTLSDTFLTSAAEGDALVDDEWLTGADGDPVPVTWDVDLYYAGDEAPAKPTADVPKGVEPVASTQVVASKGAGERLYVELRSGREAWGLRVGVVVQVELSARGACAPTSTVSLLTSTASRKKRRRPRRRHRRGCRARESQSDGCSRPRPRVSSSSGALPCCVPTPVAGKG
ncbi:hypothetical protein [Demequina litorisediminis]|uniref:hypothetical protein n=1 Tax=Demequina litorisediminis TaxID=1849022 RepID=UPI0024E1539F|nr:hypothetical protein [Demequina litorisediminis]